MHYTSEITTKMLQESLDDMEADFQRSQLATPIYWQCITDPEYRKFYEMVEHLMAHWRDR